MKFNIGKIPGEYLSKLLSNIKINDKRVVKGPEIGEDAAVIDMGDKYLIAKTDPITFVSDRIGWYSIHINANDIAALGATPLWFLATVLLPEKSTDEKLIKDLFNDIYTSCREINVSLCGGHTEVTPGLDRTIIVGQMLGEVKKENLIDKKNIKPGNDIILAKGIPIEAAAIIADAKREEVQKVWGNEFLERALNFIFNPGISVVQAAKIAVESGKINGMHDPTEGGLLGGLWELAFLSNTGFRIHKDQIFVHEEAKLLCDHYNLDPLRIIASGSLIIIAEKSGSEKIVEKLCKNNIPSNVIGTVTKKSEGRILIDKNNNITEIKSAVIDEIGKLL